MASTYKPSRALLRAESFLHKKPVTNEGANILDQICKMIWMAAPWRWTLGSLPVVTLAAQGTGVEDFTGTGLDDATITGTITDTAATISVAIDAEGTPDTFKWRQNSGSWTNGVAITGSAQSLALGVSITFAATTGHTDTDAWVIRAAMQQYELVLPSDFLFVHSAELTDTDDLRRPMAIEPAIPPTHGCSGIPSHLVVTGTPGATGQMDILPQWGTTLPSPAPYIVSLYKKTAPSITDTNLDTDGTLVMDDAWFWVFETGVMWLAYKFGNDPRAGNVVADMQTVRYTGEFAAFIAALRWMADREKLPLNEVPSPGVTWKPGG